MFHRIRSQANYMLSDTQILGITPNNLTFVKRFPDANKSQFAVAGLAANAARTLDVSHQQSSDGSVRSMISLNEVDVNPGSAVGKTDTTRVYIVIQRPATKSAGDVKAIFARLKTIVDSTAIQDQILNQEV